MQHLDILDNRYVVHSRNNELANPAKSSQDGNKRRVENGLVHLTPTPYYKALKLMWQLQGLGYENLPQLLKNKEVPSPASNEEKNHKKKKHKKKKGNKKHKKHKKFKDKKGTKKMSKHIRNTLTERNERNSNLMAELIKNADNLLISERRLWVYNYNTGCYEYCDAENVASKLRMLLDEKDRMKVSSQEYKEAYNQLMISEELKSEKEFFANKPFVNCCNGVVDVMNQKLLPHSPSYRFKHCIGVNYNPDAKCKKFLAFVHNITDGDEELTELLRAIMGYILSHYNNAKMAFLLYAGSNTGKSVLCKVIESIIGKEYVSHCDLAYLHKQEYAATLSGKLLNIAPDIKNESLKDVGFFKSLTSHNDTISARLLYVNPGDVKGETKMLFSTNHLLAFDTKLDTGDIEAVFNRFLYFPFQNKPIEESEDNKNFADEILAEKDGIFSWAMGGLLNYIENNENFPHSRLSKKLKLKNISQYCPEKSFFEKCIVVDNDCRELTEAVKEAFENFCKENDVVVRGNIRKYITKHKKIPVRKKRINSDRNASSTGSPRAIYEGIRLRDKYRVS